MKVSKTSKGKDCVSFRGYSYRLHRKSADGITCYWRCSQYQSGCPGRLITSSDYKEPRETRAHNHDLAKDYTVSKTEGSRITDPSIPLIDKGDGSIPTLHGIGFGIFDKKF